MVLGMSLQTFTTIHVFISLAGIASGLIVMYGLVNNRRLDSWTAVFLITTALTSITGFIFPFKGVTPGIVIGILSMLVLAVASLVRYPLRLSWPKTYVIASGLALYFNVFVLIVQSFEKVPTLHALAPTQKEPPFAIAQLVVLALFIRLTWQAVKKFRADPESRPQSKAKAA
jgi:hypothetical protein